VVPTRWGPGGMVVGKTRSHTPRPWHKSTRAQEHQRAGVRARVCCGTRCWWPRPAGAKVGWSSGRHGRTLRDRATRRLGYERGSVVGPARWGQGGMVVGKTRSHTPRPWHQRTGVRSDDGLRRGGADRRRTEGGAGGRAGTPPAGLTPLPPLPSPRGLRRMAPTAGLRPSTRHVQGGANKVRAADACDGPEESLYGYSRFWARFVQDSRKARCI